MSKVLAFHKLLDGFSFDSTCISPVRFRRTLQYLTDHGWRFSNPLIDNNSQPGNDVVITFDDGYEHLREALPPLIDEFEFKPLIFIPTAWIGKTNEWDYSHFLKPCRHLSEEGIRDLASLGVKFGSHGHRHVALDQCSSDQLISELTTSKQVLQDILGESVCAISYPFGRTNQCVLDAAVEAGYTTGFTMAANLPGIDSPLARPRSAVYAWDTLLCVRNKLSDRVPERLECFKSNLTNRLSAGTVLWQCLRGRQGSG